MSDLTKFILSLLVMAAIGIGAGYFMFDKPASEPIEVYKTKDSLVFISDSTGYKAVIDSLQAELKNCNNEKFFISSQNMKLKKQVDVIITDSVKNISEYEWVKSYKKENNLK